MPYHKILVPVDGSEHSGRAVLHALDLARPQGAQITLMHCYDHIPLLIGGQARVELSSELRTESEALCQPFAQTLRQAGLDPVLLLCEGHPEKAIVEEARTGGYDLIVMGSRGLSDLEGMLLGSVAHRVLALAPCPVLVTR